MGQGKLIVVAGGQFGSEAKGHVAGYLARQDGVLAIRVAGPNAGHTVRHQLADGTHIDFKLRCIPTAAVTNPNAELAIAAGSEIHEKVLFDEIDSLEEHGIKVRHRLWVDPQATELTDSHVERETGLVERIGSTGKGIGAARTDRIMRVASLWGDLPSANGDQLGSRDVAMLANMWLRASGTVLIEGTQGYGLGLHAGYYPQCTSSDCRIIDFCAMAGVMPWGKHVAEFEPWLVFRTYPIRVAGPSGPLKGELTWDEVGVAEEHTTVTGKVRRVGQWDLDLARDAIRANGGNVNIALMHVDYLVPEIAGTDGGGSVNSEAIDSYVNVVTRHEREIGLPIQLIGTGPDTIIDRRG